MSLTESRDSQQVAPNRLGKHEHRGLEGVELTTFVVLVAALIAWWSHQLAIGIAAVVLGAVYLIQENGVRRLGLSRPASWPRVALWGILAFIGSHLVLIAASRSILSRMRPPDLSAFSSLRGNRAALAIWLVVAWTSAAFGEEIIFRGGLLQWFYDDASKKLETALAVVVSSIVFGTAHAYQGISGVISAALVGAVYGVVFVAARRNLWASIIGHALYDTSGLLMVFFGIGGNSR